jgi:hypothetical protein
MKKVKLSTNISKILDPIGIRNIISNEIDLLDIGSNDSTISYIQQSRIQKMQEKNLDPWTDLRTEVRLGKFLNKHFHYSPEQIENLINKYKMFYNFYQKDGINLFEEVSGTDIVYWYNAINYKTGGGTLNHSCMRNENPDRFVLYTGTPDKIKLLIIKEGDKLIGRALLWIDDKGRKYLDRAYTRYDETMYLYEMYAQKKGYYSYYKKENAPDDFLLTTNPEARPRTLPYLDSMMYSCYNNNSIITLKK